VSKKKIKYFKNQKKHLQKEKKSTKTYQEINEFKVRLKLDKIKKIFLEKNSQRIKELETSLDRVLQPIVLFFSVSDIQTRARVFKGRGLDFNIAWEDATQELFKFLSLNKEYDVRWAKVDIVNHFEKIHILDLNEILKQIHFAYFYRKGISFDENFEQAFLEEEINGNKLLKYYSLEDMEARKIDFESVRLNLSNINNYRKIYFLAPPLKEIPTEIYTFSTISYFLDENENIYELYRNNVDKGRRKIEKITDEVVYDTILKASHYLHDLIDENGKFIYGYFPIFGKAMANYNILRHTSSLWSLINLYRITKDKKILKNLDLAIDYMIENNIEYGDFNTAFLVERSVDEIKLGGNGLALIMLTEYTDILKSKKYIALIKMLANGIIKMQNEDGSFVHILDFPTFSVKEEFRVVYYDGEAVFGLARAYSVTKEKRFLDAAVLGVENFIDKNYVRYTDHWVAYALNEVTKYLPNSRYFEFALRNINENLPRIYRRKTSFHTFLELLTIGWETYERAINCGLDLPYLKNFDVERFATTIYRRVRHMLNGFFYPEIAMYMKFPNQILNSFMVKHHAYRARIDDIQHFIGGYYFYIVYYEKIHAHLNLDTMNFDCSYPKVSNPEIDMNL